MHNERIKTVSKKSNKTAKSKHRLDDHLTAAGPDHRAVHSLLLYAGAVERYT